MISFRKLIDNGIATEKRLFEDMQSIVKEPISSGDFGEGYTFFEGQTSYGRMRIEAKLNPKTDGYEIQEAYMLYLTQ